jgi:hypothetical protein
LNIRIINVLSIAQVLAIAISTYPAAQFEPAAAEPFDGFNVIATRSHPFGSASAKLALANAKGLGARAIAIVPFLWRSSPTNPDLVRGTDIILLAGGAKECLAVVWGDRDTLKG